MDQTSGFTALDIDSALLISDDNFAVAVFEGFSDNTTNAITLQNLIIFNDNDEFDALFGSDGYVTPVEFRNGGGSSSLRSAIGTLLHELVHARQYRDLGATRFVEEYFVDIIRFGYKSVPLEREARAYKARIAERLGGSI